MRTRSSTFRLLCIQTLLWLALTALPAAPAAAGNGSGDRASRPKIVSGFSSSERLSILLAFGTAAKKVQERQSCRALFEDLDLGGSAALSRTFYEPATRVSDLALCEQGAVAVTGLEGRRTRLCKSFRRHSLRDRAGILLHEALHVAGLSERPIDPDGLTPHQISHTVKRACGL